MEAEEVEEVEVEVEVEADKGGVFFDRVGDESRVERRTGGILAHTDRVSRAKIR